MQRLYGRGFSLYWYGKGMRRGICEEYAKGFTPRIDVAPFQGLVVGKRNRSVVGWSLPNKTNEVRTRVREGAVPCRYSVTRHLPLLEIELLFVHCSR